MELENLLRGKERENTPIKKVVNIRESWSYCNRRKYFCLKVLTDELEGRKTHQIKCEKEGAVHSCERGSVRHGVSSDSAHLHTNFHISQHYQLKPHDTWLYIYHIYRKTVHPCWKIVLHPSKLQSREIIF